MERSLIQRLIVSIQQVATFSFFFIQFHFFRSWNGIHYQLLQRFPPQGN